MSKRPSSNVQSKDQARRLQTKGPTAWSRIEFLRFPRIRSVLGPKGYSPDMTIVREDSSGPVLSMIPFDTDEDAVKIANDTECLSTNYAQTRDPDRLRRMARLLRAGMVEMNGKGRRRGSPFGGI